MKHIRKLLNKRIKESANNNCIVVDIQPMYEKWIAFSIPQFVDYLESKSNVLFFYVGVENSGIGEDTKEDIMFWLVENGLSEDKLEDITFIDKGYAFFRGKMDDTTFDDADIVDMIKYLIDNDLRDTRDIEDSEVRNDLGLEEDPEDEPDPLYLPSEFDIEDCSGFENSELVGGGRNECLKEMELFFKAYDFPYHLNNKFIYYLSDI